MARLGLGRGHTWQGCMSRGHTWQCCTGRGQFIGVDTLGIDVYDILIER